MSKFKILKGYRIRLVIDIPIWEFSKSKALQEANLIALNSHSAAKVMKVECIKIDEPNNAKLFSEDQPKFNPSKRNQRNE